MTRVNVPCVGGVVVDGRGRLLLVKRGQEPAIGTWSIPGGRVEPGEDDRTATAREVLEETALPVVVGAFAGAVNRDAPDGSLYVIHDYLCVPADDADPEAVTAGDDAADVGWFTPDEVHTLDCAPGLVDALVSWEVLAAPSPGVSRSTPG